MTVGSTASEPLHVRELSVIDDRGRRPGRAAFGDYIAGPAGSGLAQTSLAVRSLIKAVAQSVGVAACAKVRATEGWPLPRGVGFSCVLV
jgi:hypothetical protein